ncbi:MAG: phospholipid carrier-dependent glycosyltransferase, partial [Planctomycetaceae bacterium]|nr:phospholipid carrier-dependent glycosyltransferase [Planctomycetaceae bacterium]
MIEPPPDRFSGSLSARGEGVSPAPPAKRLITALIILCAIPRLLMMWRIDAVCNDAYYYISIADLLDRGQFEGAFEYLNLNVYPVVLLLFHKLGIDWVTGGQLWGVFISSLVVAPMFGWIRHAFNDKVAIVACFLYAIQPQLIEISAEPIREPMFWFFFNLCLYFCWRSVTSVKWWMFVASGITFGLASYTRSEGWLLLLPILLWPIL